MQNLVAVSHTVGLYTMFKNFDYALGPPLNMGVAAH